MSASAYFPPDVAVKLSQIVPTVRYDPGSGDSLQVSVKLPAAIGAKAWLAADAANLSVSGLLAELVRQMPVDVALVNGFGFGGQNAVALFKRYE